MQNRGPAESVNCAQCPCARGRATRNPVRGAGCYGGLAIVGEAPASEEVAQGWPFVGPTGKLLNSILSRLGIDRHAAWIGNSLLCRRPQDDGAFATAVDCCRPRLAQELREVAPRCVLALGAVAARALQLPVSTIFEARGTVQESTLLPGVPVIVSLHPAALFKGGAGEVSAGKQKANVDAQLLFLEADIAKADAIARGVTSPIWSDDVQVVADDGLAAAQKIIAEAREWGVLGLDLEWMADGTLTWIGLGWRGRSVSFCADALSPEAWACIGAAFADPLLPKLAHNLQADKGAWEAYTGWRFAGEVEDTMLLHHAAFPGIAHDLQAVASQFLTVPPWKAMRKGQRKAVVAAERISVKETKKAERVAAHEARNAIRKREKAARDTAKAAAKARKTALARTVPAPVLAPTPAPVLMPEPVPIPAPEPVPEPAPVPILAPAPVVVPAPEPVVPSTPVVTPLQLSLFWLAPTTPVVTPVASVTPASEKTMSQCCQDCGKPVAHLYCVECANAGREGWHDGVHLRGELLALCADCCRVREDGGKPKSKPKRKRIKVVMEKENDPDGVVLVNDDTPEDA